MCTICDAQNAKKTELSIENFLTSENNWVFKTIK